MSRVADAGGGAEGGLTLREEPVATSSLTGDPHAGTVGATAHNRHRDLSHLTHRQLIGWLGLLLPFVLFILAGLWYTAGLPRWGTLESISAYYYTGATSAFVGMLFALALFLLTYGGYEDDLADRVMGKLGGISALGVAFFPTKAPGPLLEPSWWVPGMRIMHYVSAVSLFVIFAGFSLWLFRKTSVPRGESLPSDKRWQNRIYLVCGIVIGVSILWAGSSRFTGSAIFWPEAVALCAFAVSWLVKGYAYRPVFSIARRLFAK